MSDIVSVTLDLPVDGTREAYLHCVAKAHTDAIRRGDRESAWALAGLLTLTDEAIAFAERGTPHFFFPKWGPTDGRTPPDQ